MNRRELLISLGLIVIPTPRLIFDYGANLHKMPPPMHYKELQKITEAEYVYFSTARTPAALNILL